MSSIAQSRPETFRLPKPGTGDPYFGITRGGYYQGEVDGWWTLIRLKRPGMKRGTTLVPFAEVEAFISKQRKQQNAVEQPAVAGKSEQHYARPPQYYQEQQQKKQQTKHHPQFGTL
jgi:hypothetical protein